MLPSETLERRGCNVPKEIFRYEFGNTLRTPMFSTVRNRNGHYVCLHTTNRGLEASERLWTTVLEPIWSCPSVLEAHDTS